MTTTPKAATSGRSNDALWAVLGLAGLVAITYLYTAPQMQALKDARAASLARQQDNQDIQAQIAQVGQLGQQLESQQAALTQLGLAAPVGAATDQLLVALQAIASESGVILLSVQPTGADAAQASAVVTLRGSYTGVHLFFELLEKNIRPLPATNVSIASAADATGIALLNVSATISAAQVVGAASKTQEVQP